jgi:protein-S-isoprenylcysteine O-methyltransferase Ste14
VVHIFCIGGFGFLFLVLYDLSQLRPGKYLLRLTSCIGYGSLILAVFLEIFLYWPEKSPPLLIILKLGALALSVGLLVYSVFIETAPGAAAGVSARLKTERTAVTKGSYGVVRHPGFWWFLLLQISVIWLTAHKDIIIIAAGLVSMNFFLILMEDRWIFPRIFSNYDEYTQLVPMLIPRIRRKG